MAEFLRSMIKKDLALVPGAAENEFDLPVNPLSHLNMTLKFLNNGVNIKATFANILTILQSVKVMYKGASVINTNLEDLAMYVMYQLGREFMMENVINTDDAARSIVMPIPFGRRLYWPDECFPATQRGDFIFKWQPSAAAVAGLDTALMSVEAVQLLEAAPKRFFRFLTKSATPTATGKAKYDLPRGNDLYGVLLRATTVPTGIVYTKSIDDATLEIDEIERYFNETRWEELHAALADRVGIPNSWSEKIHRVTAAPPTDTDGEEQVNTNMNNYALMDLDPLLNDQYAIKTEGLGSLRLVLNHGDVQAVKICTIESVPVPGGG